MDHNGYYDVLLQHHGKYGPYYSPFTNLQIGMYPFLRIGRWKFSGNLTKYWHYENVFWVFLKFNGASGAIVSREIHTMQYLPAPVGVSCASSSWSKGPSGTTRSSCGSGSRAAFRWGGCGRRLQMRRWDAAPKVSRGPALRWLCLPKIGMQGILRGKITCPCNSEGKSVPNEWNRGSVLILNGNRQTTVFREALSLDVSAAYLHNWAIFNERSGINVCSWS